MRFHQKSLSFKASTIILLFLLLTPFGLFFAPSSGKPWNEVIPHIDKMIHFGLFAIWSMTFLWKFQRHQYLFLSGVLLGIFTEFAQHFIPTRAFSWWDIAADFAGILFVFSWEIVRRKMAIKNAKARAK